MERIFLWFLLVVAVVGGFVAALFVAPFCDVAITVPGKLVGAMAGVLVFVVTLLILIACSIFAADLIFHKSCRVVFADMLSYGWSEWKYVTPSILAGIVAALCFGILAGLGTALVSYLLGSVAAYLYCRERLIAAVGAELFYRDAQVEKG